MERKYLRDLRPLGYLDDSQLSRLLLGIVLLFPALVCGALTVDGILDVAAGRHIDHLVSRILVFIVAVFCATFGIGLTTRIFREARYTITGLKAQGTITAVEEGPHGGRWFVTYRFQDRQGNRREGKFVAYAPEWAVGDEGDVCHADGWDGSLWMSMSERPLPPAKSPYSLTSHRNPKRG